MKKLFLFLVMFTFMFFAIGKANAGVGINTYKDDTYNGGSNKHKTDIILQVANTTYTADTQFTLEFIQTQGVDHFDISYLSPDIFEVVQDKTPINGNQYNYNIIIKLKRDLAPGEYDLLSLIVTHDDNFDDCNVWVFIDEFTPSNKTCADSVPANNQYYNNAGIPISAQRYAYECQPHNCQIFTLTENNVSTKHYFNKDGIEVTKDQFDTVKTTECGCLVIDDGHGNISYYNWDDTVGQQMPIPKDEYEFYCEKRVCTTFEFDGKTYYYNSNGEKVETEEEMNAACKCRYDATADKYYDLENKEVSKEEYEKQCLCRTEDGKDGNKEYYCKKGEVCTAEEFENQCPKDVKTGANLPLIAIIGGSVLAGASIIIANRKNKLKKI